MKTAAYYNCMKHLIIFIMLLPLAFPLFAKGDFFRGIDVTSDTKVSVSSQKPDTTKMKFSLGAKLKCKNLTASVQASVPATRVFTGENPFAQWPDFKWNISWTAIPRKLPVTAQLNAGKLQIQGTVSRLRSPVPLQASSLTKQGIPLQTIGISSSVKAPLAASLSLQGTSPVTALPTLQGAVNCNGELFFAAAHSFFPTDDISIKAGASIAMFKYGRPVTSVWKMKTRPYSIQNLWAAELSASLSSSFLNVFAAWEIYQSPFGANYQCGRFQGSLAIKSFLLNADFFISDPALIASGGSSPLTVFQAQLCPGFIFNLGSICIKTGLSGLYALKVKDSIKFIPYENISIKWENSISGKKSSATIGASILWNGAKQNLSVQAQGAYRHTFKVLTSSTSFSAKWQEESFSTSLSQSVYPKQGIVNQAQAGFTLSTRKADPPAVKVQSSVTLKKQWNKASLTARFGMDFTL